MGRVRETALMQGSSKQADCVLLSKSGVTSTGLIPEHTHMHTCMSKMSSSSACGGCH